MFIFAEFISTNEREEQLREVIYNSVKAYNPILESNEIINIVERLMERGVTPENHIEFDYKSNFIAWKLLVWLQLELQSALMNLTVHIKENVGKRV